MSGPTAGGPREGVRTATVEAVVAAITLAIGLVVAVQSWQLGARWTDDGPGAGYFPFYVGLVIGFASAVTLLKALRLRAAGDRDIFVDRPSLRRVLQVLVPAALYVLAVQFVGIYVASALYIAFFMALLGGYSWLRSLGVGIAVSVFFFLMFAAWVKVPLFKGELDPTRFLGY